MERKIDSELTAASHQSNGSLHIGLESDEDIDEILRATYKHVPKFSTILRQ